MTNTDPLGRLLTQMAPTIDDRGVWESVEKRARKRAWLPGVRSRRAAWVGDQSPSLRRAAAPRRRSGTRTAIVALVSVLLVAGVGTGVFELVTYLRGLEQNGPTAGSGPTLLIGDPTAETMGPGEATTRPTPGELPAGTWLRLPLMTEGRATISTLAMDPGDPSTLYLATSVGLFKSTDGAGSWGLLPTIPGTEPGSMSVLLDPASPSAIYVAYMEFVEADEMWTTYLLRSDDGGLTWTDLNEAGAPRFGSTSSGPWLDTTTSPSTIYLYDDTGYVQRSTDRGMTWTRLTLEEGQEAFARANTHGPQPRPPAAQQALDQFLDSCDGTITDADTGAAVSIAIQTDPILVDPEHPATFYVATDGYRPRGCNVYKSTDGGHSWRQVSPDLVIPDPAVTGILVDPNAPSTLYATTATGIFRSTDDGTEWELILEGGGFGDSLVVVPSNPTRLYASVGARSDCAGLFRSDDGGTNWTRLNDPKGSDICLAQVVLAIADQPDTVFAIAEEVYWGPVYLFRSTDAGNSWQRTDLRVGPGYFGPVVVADPQRPSAIYAYGTDENSVARVFRSADAGASWTRIDLDPKEWGVPDPDLSEVVSLAIDPYNPDTLWAVQDDLSDDTGRSIIHRSTDGGATWETVTLDGLERWVMWLLFDRRSPNTLYALTGPENPWEGTIYRSTDGGATWRNIGRNVPTDYCSVAAPDTAPGGALYAATPGGLFKWVPRD